MSSCNNNCEAVAGLHEAAANLIQYRNQINKWVNGGIGETVDIGGVDTPTLLNLAMSIKQLVGVWPDNITIKIDPNTKKIYAPLKINGGVHVDASGLYIDSSDFLQLGGGLAKDANGNIYVDFDEMPTTKFDNILETFRKGLRLQKWLTANTNFYVDKNHAAASDELDEGRGLTPAKPFKNIQPCADYVCNNFNLGPYIATIHVAPGTYAPLNLGEFTRTTGYIHIIGDDASQKPIIKQTERAMAVGCSGGNWRMTKMKIAWEHDFTGVTGPSGLYSGAFQAANSGIISISGCAIELIQTGINSSGRNRSCFGFLASGTGVINLDPGEWGSSISFNFSDPTHFRRHALAAEGGTININATNSEGVTTDIACSGSFTEFAYASSKGSIERSVAFENKLFFSGSCTGKRYSCVTGGTINTGNAGAEYFPGDTAGTVDAATYSWYK